ncbi:MAG: hypothetical protein JNL85_07680 [Rubrivivax sp.]|nr:hypothetical protein [Rubrivivax sp.]
MADRRRFLFLLPAALAVAAGGCAWPSANAAGQLVQMQIVERGSGETLPEVRHRGTAYVAGRPGERYAVRLSNRSGGRVLVVLSVDGVNAVTGETAATGQTGYVLAPWQTADITGWRKSDAEAAAFYFTALPDSYAARTERPHNVGVVGIAVFRERAPRPAPFEAVPYSSRGRGEGGRSGGSDSREGRGDSGGSAGGTGATRAAENAAAGAPAPAHAPAAAAPARDERLGTGHGEREYSPIGRTSFERASANPAEVVQIRYDSHANLAAAGIWPPPRRPLPVVPEPFPGYVPDPR